MKAAIPLACYNMTAGLSDPTVASDTTQTIKVKLKLVNASSHQISPIHESANIIIDMNKMRISIKRRDYRWNDAYLKVWSSVIFLPIIIKYPTVISRIPLLLFNKGNIKFFFFFFFCRVPVSRIRKPCGSEIKVRRKSPTGTIAQFHLYLFYTQNKQRKKGGRRDDEWNMRLGLCLLALFS